MPKKDGEKDKERGANIADTWVCKNRNCKERNEHWRVQCKRCKRKKE